MPSVTARRASSGRQKLVEFIQQSVRARRLRPGEKLRPTHELAKQCGVAPRTAHLALRDLVASGVLVRSRGKGTYVAKRSPRAVALLTPCEGHVWADFAAALVSGLQQMNAPVYVLANGDEEVLASPMFDAFLAAQPLAAISKSDRVACRLVEKHPELYCISIEGERADDFPGDVVAPDPYRAGLLATRHLLALGHTRIGCYPSLVHPGAISPDGRTLFEPPFTRGYRAALRGAGLPYEAVGRAWHDSGSKERIHELLCRAERPTGVVSPMDYWTIFLVKEARALGLRVPEDLAIVSCNNTPWAEAYDLTSVDLRLNAVAEKCLELIALAAEDKRSGRVQVRLEPKLVVRSSCGGARPPEARR
jgi:DNA-binding LacI/PurR family transcriptional regulator